MREKKIVQNYVFIRPGQIVMVHQWQWFNGYCLMVVYWFNDIHSSLDPSNPAH